MKITPPFIPDSKAYEDFNYVDNQIVKEKPEDSFVDDINIQIGAANSKKDVLKI